MLLTKIKAIVASVICPCPVGLLRKSLSQSLSPLGIDHQELFSRWNTIHNGFFRGSVRI